MTDAPKIDTQAPERIWADQDELTWVEADPDEYMRSWETAYIRADLSAAREAAAAQAMREAAAKVPDSMIVCYLDGSTGAGEDIAQEIRALPLPDTTALDRLIAERVREAYLAGHRTARAWSDDVLSAEDGFANFAARASKEDR